MISKADFKEEAKRIRKLKKQGRTDDWIKSWLTGWRQPARLVKKR